MKRPISILEVYSDYHEVTPAEEKIVRFGREIRSLAPQTRPQRLATSPLDVYLDKIRAAGKNGNIVTICSVNDAFIIECEKHVAKDKEERLKRSQK